MKKQTEKQSLRYLDNAATSWPKPPEVKAAMSDFLDSAAGNPGRAGHRLSNAAGRVVDGAREAVAELFGCSDPLRVAFGSNGTEALNLALNGLLRPGDHVVTSSMEHNATMRPLRALEHHGVQLTCVPCSPEGCLDPADLQRALRKDTALVTLIHASNVTGTLMPVPEVGKIARERGIPFMVDAASTAGVHPIDMERDGIDLLAFTGHKGMMGPSGTGGLVVGETFDARRIAPLKRGGTGSRSESEEQPTFMPDAFESGTPNAVGLAGLLAALQWVQKRGVARIQKDLGLLTRQLLAGLSAIPGLTIQGLPHAQGRTSTVSFTLDNISPSEAGMLLDEQFGVLCRVGLHCSPAAHRTLGTFPLGTIRFAPGIFTSSEDLDAALNSVAILARR